jgi:NAD(P) transhydrogenase subunit alpha
MYSKNILTFFQSLLKDGRITINLEDEVCRDTLVTRDGHVVNERIKALLAPAR